MSPLYVGSTPVTIPGMGGGAAGLPTYGMGLSSGTIIANADATPHTKGAWVEVIDAMPLTSNLAVVHPTVGANGVATDTLIDIALGAAGAEVPFISNLAVGGITSPWPVLLPVTIPSGSRVAMRSQSVTASRSSTHVYYFYDDVATGVASATGVLDVMTTDTSSSRGVLINSGLGWVEATAATTKAYKSVILVPSTVALINPINNALLRVGSGAVGAEVTLAEVSVVGSNTESVWTGTTHPSPLLAATTGPVAAGTRLSVSTSSSFSMGACLIGVPA